MEESLKEELKRLRFLEKILTMALEEPEKAKTLLVNYQHEIKEVRRKIASQKLEERKGR